MTGTRVVVFMPYDIHLTGAQFDGQQPSAACDGTRYYSTGLLEAAVEAGYTVYVICPYASLAAQDAWWVPLVGKKNVFLMRTERRKSMGASNPDLLDPVRLLFDRLGIDWPSDLTNWTQLRSVFERVGLMSGCKLAPVQAAD